MRNRDKIELTESAHLPLETVKQALQLHFGREIGFVNATIAPEKIMTQADKTETRRVRLEACFFLLDDAHDATPSRAYAEVDMRRLPNAFWQATRIHFGLGQFGAPLHLWGWAHVIGEERVLPTMKVVVETPGFDTQWKIGRTFADRRLEPLFGRRG